MRRNDPITAAKTNPDGASRCQKMVRQCRKWEMIKISFTNDAKRCRNDARNSAKQLILIERQNILKVQIFIH